jgi:hypothetical protein
VINDGRSIRRVRGPIGLGIAGLGMAGAMMVRAAARHPGFRLRAAADPLAAPREALARDFNARAYADIDALCEDATVDAVYIATPHQFHAAHALRAAAAGKHIILEKPMALTLADCDAINAAVAKAGVHLIIGHTHAYDPAIRVMRSLIASGELGRLGMIASWNYTNYLYRPRRPEELDTARGGGILFNQVPHRSTLCAFSAAALSQACAPRRARSIRRGRPKAMPSRSSPSRMELQHRSSMAATISSTATSGMTGFPSAERANSRHMGKLAGRSRRGRARRPRCGPCTMLMARMPTAAAAARRANRRISPTLA